MTTTTFPTSLVPPSTAQAVAALDDIIARHGAARLLLALVLRPLRRPPRRPRAALLSAHLRRDIGLAALPPTPPSALGPPLPLVRPLAGWV